MSRSLELAQDRSHVREHSRDRTLLHFSGAIDQSLDATLHASEYTRRVSVAPTTISTDASYRTLLTLAVGGMGRVDLAVRREGNFERLFAIKRLLPELSSDTEVRSMFLDETRIAGLLRHPNVVSIVDVGQDETGPLAVMEFVDGISVAELLAKDAVHPLPMEVALRIAVQVAEGLHAAHELVGPDGTRLELVHRDVSPQNILLGFDGIARVTDFGVAKALGRTSKTSTGVLKGKLGYISPEQLRFEEPDRRADLFALGVVLFELLTGQRLYRSQDGMDGPRRILTEPPPDLADHRDDAEPELVALLFELLAKNRDARPETAKVVARRLEGILATLTAGGPPIETAEFVAQHFTEERKELTNRINAARERPLSRRPAPRSDRSRALWAGGIFAAALLAALGFFFMRGHANDAAAQVEPVPATDTPTAPASVTVFPVADAAPAAITPPAPAGSEPSTSKRRVRPPAPRTKTKPGVPIWENY
jgi:serine/threonine-protein kinase